MGLRVWLPLNGEPAQHGTDNINIAVSGATVNTFGKIGSCYLFDGSDDFISLNGSSLYDIFAGGSQQFSVCFWVYHNDSTRAIIFGDYGLSGAINFNIELLASHAVRFYWSGTPDKSFSSASNVVLQKWTHIVITYDGAKLSIYKNGVLSSDSWSGTLAEKNKTSGLFYLGRDTRTGETALNGRLNDFRIYDYALSPAEVHRIAQGLTVHYKLDDTVFSNKNLLSNSSPHLNTLSGWSSAGTNWTNSIVQYEGEYVVRCTFSGADHANSGGIHHPVYDVATYENGQVYTFSGWVRASVACKVTFQNELMTTGKVIDVTTEWKFFSHTSVIDTSRTYRSNVCYVQTASAVNGMWIEAKKWKLEKSSVPTPWVPHTTDVVYNVFMGSATKIQDSSGYNYNATLTGTVTGTTDTAKYRICPVFASGQYILSDLRVGNFLPKDAITVNVWAKYSAYNANIISCTEGGGWNFENSSGYIQFPVYIASVGYKTAKATTAVTSLNGDWHMYTGVFDGANVKIYIDGQLEATTATGSANGIGYANTLLGIACEVNTSTTPASGAYAGQISDVRVYATALSDNDIIELYHTNLKIDKSKKMYTYSLSEYSDTSIDQRGVLHGVEFTEANTDPNIGKYFTSAVSFVEI